MIRYLHHLSGFYFYLLGISFFLMHVFSRNKLGGPWPTWWMQVADLPLALVAILFGGSSLYLSITKPDQSSKMAPLLIAVPLTLLFVILVVFNFSPIREF